MVWNKLTIYDVKENLSKLTKDIIILSDTYEGNKVNMDCKCLVCGNKFPKSWNQMQKGRHCPACGKNGVKISKQEIRDHVSKYGYSIVAFTKDDSNKGTMFEVKCPKNHKYETSYREFNRENKKGGSCKTCSQEDIGKSIRKPIEEVMRNIIEWGYTVEDNFVYKNSRERHTFTCENGHVRDIGYAILEKYPRCPECNGNPNKHTDNDIKDILSELNLEYIGGYKGSHYKFKFRCECGEITENTLKSIRKGIRCRKCNKHKAYTYEDVKNLFENEDYLLLENEYIHSKYNMKYICSKGHDSKISLNSFLRGVRCRKCYDERIRGENSPHWNPNLTDDERMKNRKYPAYQKWRRLVYERDDYTCQCCGDDTGHNLNAHHLDSHDWAKDERLDVKNGKTLCEPCHKDFHHKYGYGNNTKEQFDEYIANLMLDNLKSNKKEKVTQ